jgi:hypothetical protein
MSRFPFSLIGVAAVFDVLAARVPGNNAVGAAAIAGQTPPGTVVISMTP